MAATRNVCRQDGVPAGHRPSPTSIPCPGTARPRSCRKSGKPPCENWDRKSCPGIPSTWMLYTWEERESIAYWWSLLSVFDASRPRSLPKR